MDIVIINILLNMYMIKDPIVSIKNIHKSYDTGANKLHVLKGLTVTIHEGEMLSIMGASGSGKSTLLNILGILDNYDAGEYKLDDKVMKNLNETQATIIETVILDLYFNPLI